MRSQFFLQGTHKSSKVKHRQKTRHVPEVPKESVRSSIRNEVEQQHEEEPKKLNGILKNDKTPPSSVSTNDCVRFLLIICKNFLIS